MNVLWSPKNHKIAISQNAILAKCQSPKSILLLNFYVNLSETFRIDVNMDFANNLVRGFLIKASEKNYEPEIKKRVNESNLLFTPYFPKRFNPSVSRVENPSLCSVKRCVCRGPGAQPSVGSRAVLRADMHIFSKGDLGPGQEGWKIFNEAYKHSTPQAKNFEKRSI